MKHSEKIKNQLKLVKTKFNKELYISYITGKIEYQTLLKTLECSDYVFKLFRKQHNLCSRLEYNRTTIQHDYFDHIDTKDKAYILGFYLADGFVCNNRLGFCINKNDEELLIKIRDILAPNASITYSNQRTNKNGIKTNKMCRLLISSKHIVNTLENYGFGRNKTYKEKSINNIVPKKLMWHFIRGYFDGDGMIGYYLVKHNHTCKNNTIKTYYNYNFNYTIVSHDLVILQDILNFYKNDNINAILYPVKNSNYLVGTHSFKEIKKIHYKLYNNADLYLIRKYKIFEEIMKIPR